MKTQSEILSIRGLKVESSSELGGSGFITILGTKGSVVWTFHDQHVSFSPLKHTHTPTWNEMCELKDLFYHDEERAFQIHPPKSEYVNIQTNCLHLWGKV